MALSDVCKVLACLQQVLRSLQSGRMATPVYYGSIDTIQWVQGTPIMNFSRGKDTVIIRSVYIADRTRDLHRYMQNSISRCPSRHVHKGQGT